MEYRYFLVGICVADLIVTYLFEKYFIGWFNRYWNNRKQQKRMESRQNNISKLCMNKTMSPMASPISSNSRDHL